MMDGNTGMMDEVVLTLVFRSLNWDPRALCVASCVSRRLRAVARRVLWRELCLSRAPRMAAALLSPGIDWHALAKLLLFCPSSHRVSPGHFAGVTRFSKTSGRSFLPRRCWADLLYVTDPCEHPADGAQDVGVFRGVFGGFMRSITRACLVDRRADLDPRVRCPYCGARAWSMTAARMAPRSAARRLGCHNGGLDYFVCVNGHLHGSCWLARLSSDDEDEVYDDDDEDDSVGC